MMTLSISKWSLTTAVLLSMSGFMHAAIASDAAALSTEAKVRVSSEGRQLTASEKPNQVTVDPQRINALMNHAKQLEPARAVERSERIKQLSQSSQLSKQTTSQAAPKNTLSNNAINNTASMAYVQPGLRDFTIYQAYSHLYDDFDQDGFYQTFTVTFDADVYGFSVGEPANVYAELYLSRNGGPWEHYYSTDIFTIYGEAEDDSYEVLTTLAQGYRTDYYDVLIDLYEVGYEDIVATISSEEADSLYALPLESSDRDTVYIEEEIIETEVIVSGGSTSGVMLIVAIGLLIMRRKSMTS
ncbi:choice-of-anchor H family protein [Shewanella sp. UCD-KL21]|uniref:choice-of-anchor H family protein n=1 Tax=Shewanella sp. UCD-KL21 TaxID=1917164 RepID=UPI00097114E3|nr:choice-of-anchor H family protein [Shewanella sp. UCD-KL21]